MGVAAVPYVRPDTDASSHVMEEQVLTVNKSYIERMLGSVELAINSDDALDDPLDDDGSLKEQLDHLPVICRFQYGPVGNVIVNEFDSLLNQYREILGRPGK